MTTFMTDEGFLGYCEIHCSAPRPRFNSQQVNRLIALADYPEFAVNEVPPNQWFELDEQQIMPLVNRAKLIRGVKARLDS